MTCAGGYIGNETAVTLAKSGISVAVCDINDEAVQKTVDKIIGIEGIAKGYTADVTESKSIDEAINNSVKI